MDHPRRIRELRDRLARENIAPLLFTHGADIHYLSGFTGSNAVLLLLPRSVVLLTDGRYTAQAHEETSGASIRVAIRKHLLRDACTLLLRSGARAISYDSEHTTVAMLERMLASLPESMAPAARRRFFEPLARSPVAAMRECKDAEELAILQEAAQLGCRIFAEVLPHLAAGVPEREIAAELEFTARRMGADRMSFETIVAAGKRSALPHGVAGAAPLPRRGFVTLDFGVMLRGYCSDMTRTVYLGKPTRQEKAAYAAVLAAEQAGIAALRPGVTAASVDGAARGTLRQQGLAKQFSHSTGHGLGLEIHEGPRLGRKVTDLIAEGMVLTVEPGIYLPGQFGIRIEDMVAVEAWGARLLTTAPRELLTL